ncbi:MAG TPA: LptF/LptG family permease [Pirellulaceae bacterium]|nr:LptF/LptG family permease [Pirellulaceae bacterium]
MTTVPRYVLLETLKTFCVAAVVILFILLMVGGAQQGARHGLPPRVIAQVLPFLVPEMLRFTLPGCLLFAVCSVFGRMSAANEILAVKAAGVNPWRVVWPVLVLSCLLSLLTFELYDVCAMWSRPGLKRTMINSTDQIIYGYLRSNKSFTNSSLSIAVKGIEDGHLVQPIIQVFASGAEKQPLTFSAQRANITCSEPENSLRFTCHHGWVEVGDNVNFAFKGIWTNEIELPSSARDDVDWASPAGLRVAEVKQQIRREESVLRDLGQLGDGGTSDMGELADEIRSHQSRLYRLQAETPRRFSNGFACLCFVMVGIPVAMWQKSADNVGVFFLCFGPILLVYYPLLVVGENLARDGLWPSLSVWLADGVLMGVGVILMRWQIRS